MNWYFVEYIRELMRDLGRLGEDTFSSWCHQVGLIPNPSIIDKTGWDFYVQFPISSNLSIQKLHKSAYECRVQVKATDKQDRKLPITISNLRQMATAQMPAFYIFLEFDGKNEVQRAFILHLDNSVIYSILKRIHEIEQSDKENNLNKRTMTLHYDESNELQSLNGEGLKAHILGRIGEDYSKYISEKLTFLESCGYENCRGNVKFSIAGKGLNELIDLSLGLTEEIDVQNLVSIEERFGIPSKKDRLEIPKAKLKIGKLNPKNIKIRFKEDTLSQGLEFDVLFYLPPFDFKEFRKFSKFRLVGDFFEITCEPYAKKANYKFFLGDENRFELKYLKKALKLIQLMSRREGVLETELDYSSFDNPLIFDLKTVFVERDLDIFEELLNKILKICSFHNIYEDIKISLKELFYFKDEIEQIYEWSISNKVCDFRSEIQLNEEYKFEFNTAASIAVVACNFGSHFLVFIISCIGEPKNIGLNKYSIKSKHIEIEKVFLFKEEQIISNEHILREIYRISDKYIQSHDVFYNWGE